MIGVEDRFGLSGKPWELIQTFGLTAEHIAERVLRLYTKKLRLEIPESEVATMSEMLECSQCHAQVPLQDYLSEAPLPTDEYCAECESRSRAGCAACWLAWMKLNSSFTFRCRDCREVVAPC